MKPIDGFRNLKFAVVKSNGLTVEKVSAWTIAGSEEALYVEIGVDNCHAWIDSSAGTDGDITVYHYLKEYTEGHERIVGMRECEIHIPALEGYFPELQDYENSGMVRCLFVKYDPQSVDQYWAKRVRKPIVESRLAPLKSKLESFYFIRNAQLSESAAVRKSCKIFLESLRNI